MSLIQSGQLLRPTSFQLAATLGAAAAWELDEASGDAKDRITTYADGTVSGPTQGSAAIFATSAGSYDFDGTGDDVVEVGAADKINNIFSSADSGSDGGSVEVWVKIESDGEGNSGRILDKRTPSGLNGWSLWTEAESGSNVALAFRHDFSGGDGEWTTAVDIEIDTVYHLVITYDKDGDDDADNNPILYVNAAARTDGGGLTESPSPSGNARGDESKDLHIGNQDGLGSSFDGLIAGVRFYDFILTAAQVSDLYESGRPT